jgi:spermidine synthase
VAQGAAEEGATPLELGEVFLGASALLGLELLDLRVFSYSIDPLLVYSAISVALLGLGAGGMAVARWPGLLADPPRVRALSLAGFSVALLGAHAIFARLSDRIRFGDLVSAALPLLLLLALPYLAAGVFLAAATARRGADIGRVYLANLAGSALGSAALYPLLRPLGAEVLLAGLACLTALAAVGVAFTRAPSARPAAAGALVLALAAVPLAGRLFPFHPDPGDLYGVARAALQKAHPGRAEGAYEPRLEYSRWDAVSRVEVYGFPGDFGLVNDRAPVRLFAQDGGAGSMLLDLRGDAALQKSLFEGTVYGGAYLLRPHPESALVIGLGGAPDLLAARYHGLQKLTGVEINRSAIEVICSTYADSLDRVCDAPGFRIEHADGRSFLERSTEHYDLVQMTGADTYSAGASGAFMFSENYLYTAEAFRRYVAALKPGGVLSIIRFGLEPLRVVSTEIEALRAAGVADPSRHLAVLSQGIWVNVLLTREPMSDEEGAHLVQEVAARARLDRVRLPVYDALGFGLGATMEVLYAPGFRRQNPYSAVIEASATGREQAALGLLALDFSPVTDDRPFFFQFISPRQLGAVLGATERDYYTRGLKAHLLFSLAVSAAAALLTLAPLAGRRRTAENQASSAERPGADEASSAQRPGAGVLGFFAALGLAYLFVELSLLQRCALFLGHPTYAAALTLGALLLWSGLGSAIAARLTAPPERIIRGAGLALVPVLLLAQPALGLLFRLMLAAPFGVRVVALTLALAPLGLLMGMPFPTGLRVLAARGEGAVAWCLGVNSVASVVASLIALPIAMFGGFSVVSALAAVLYGLAALGAPRP